MAVSSIDPYSSYISVLWKKEAWGNCHDEALVMRSCLVLKYRISILGNLHFFPKDDTDGEHLELIYHRSRPSVWFS